MTDEEIIKLIIKGDREKFGKIIDRYEKRLRGFIYKMIGKSAEVDDLVEDSLIAAYQNLQGFDAKLKFSSWILRIAHNKTVDFIKKKKPIFIEDDERVDSYQLRVTNENQRLFEEIEIKDEEKRDLVKAIDKLELKYREVIILYFFEEKSYEEISDILRTTVSNVGVMIKRAKDKLRKHYETK